MLTGLSAWWGTISLQHRLQILIQGCLLGVLVGAQLWLTDQFERQSLEAVEAQAAEIADGAINGLNTMMVTRVGNQELISDKAARALFIQKMGASEKIQELRIFRDKQLDSEFPAGLPQEQPIDALDRKVLATGKPEFKLVLGDNGAASLRTVMPFIASKDFRTTNCLECHSVAEGAVLGAASVTIDVKDKLAAIENGTTLFWVAQGMLQIILYFVIGLIVRRLARQLGGEPNYVIDILKQIAKGNLSQRIVTQAGDTTSVLAAVKQMQDEVKQAEAALEAHRQQLEELVESRTSELAKAKDAAETANVTKDTFLANISHEMRTPLNGVIGMAGLAREISTEARQRDYLDKIVRSGKHLNRIINELLDLTKIAAGRMEFEITTFSLSGLLEHSQSLMANRAEEKGLELVQSIDTAVPDVLKGDPVRIEQIMLNLVGNAIKFTPKGRVEVRISLHACEGSRVCLDIEVIDTGVGIPPEGLAHIFEPFSQADPTISRKFGGTGLGLAISRRLARIMEGDITVTSIEGSGTTFHLRIWLEPGDAADLPPAESLANQDLPRRYRDVRVLVVEDQALNREIVEALLNAVGIVAQSAEDGRQALDILTAAGPGAFDLVLMDVQMPVMDGLTATRTLRRRKDFDSLPIICMTAHTMAHEKRISADAGMTDHIAKPFDNPSFYRTLARWIARDKQEVRRPEEELLEPAAPPASAENALSTLRGVDVAAGRARFGGNEVRYRHWLADFAATAGAIPEAIRSDIGAGHPDQAARTVHGFKGRVGMLGMTELYDIVSALERALSERAPADGLLSSLEQEISRMRDQLIIKL